MYNIAERIRDVSNAHGVKLILSFESQRDSPSHSYQKCVTQNFYFLRSHFVTRAARGLIADGCSCSSCEINISALYQFLELDYTISPTNTIIRTKMSPLTKNIPVEENKESNQKNL